MSYRDKVVWITGAGKGIGRALAIELAGRGALVVASARTQSDLESLIAEAPTGQVVAYALDVTDEIGSATAVAEIEQAHGPIDIAVLNAGTHQPVTPETLSAEPFRKLMEVNFFGVVNGLVPLSQAMRRHGKGTIAVVSSVAGYVGLPTASAYGAGKAALINMCEALRVELAAEGVDVKLVCPGFVETPLTDKNDFAMPFIIPAEKAARIMADKMLGGGFEIAYPTGFALIMKLLRLLPYPLLWPLTKRMVRK